MDTSQKLSENFTLGELIYSSTAVSKGISNLPNEKELANLKYLVKTFLQPLRDELKLPIRINSGFRSQALNNAIPGSSKTSAHCYGLAVDIVCPSYKGGNVREFCLYVENFVKKNNIKFDQIIYEFVGGARWCHFGIKHPDGRQRSQLLTIHNRKTEAGFKNV